MTLLDDLNAEYRKQVFIDSIKLMAILIVVGATLGLLIDTRNRIARIENKINCLASPHGESSIGPVTVKNGKVVAGRTTPTTTGCIPKAGK